MKIATIGRGKIGGGLAGKTAIDATEL